MRKEVLQEKRVYILEHTPKMDQKLVNRLRLEFDCLYAYEAMAIEGKNSYTQEEVTQLLNGKTIPNKTTQETLEILNHQKAFDLVKNLVKEEVELTEELLKDIHQHLLEGIMNGGLYRNMNIQIMGAIHQPCDHIKVYDRMKKMFLNLSEFEGNMVEKACYAHLQIAKIHPFLDGNGRLARLVMNYYLLKAGYLAVSIPKKDREFYFAAMEEFKINKNMKPFVDFIINLLEKRMDSCINAIAFK